MIRRSACWRGAVGGKAWSAAVLGRCSLTRINPQRARNMRTYLLVTSLPRQYDGQLAGLCRHDTWDNYIGVGSIAVHD